MSQCPWVRIFFAGVATLPLLLVAGFAEAKAESSFKKQVVPFFEEYCIRCHGPEKSKGQISLHTLDGDLSTGRDLERWEDVLEMLESGEMPTDFKPSRNVIPSLNSRIPPRLSEELRTRGDNADRGCDAPDINIQSMPATTVFPGDFEHRLAPRQHEVGLCLEFAWCIAKVPRAGE